MYILLPHRIHRAEETMQAALHRVLLQTRNRLSIARGSVGDWCVVADARGTLDLADLAVRI